MNFLINHQFSLEEKIVRIAVILGLAVVFIHTFFRYPNGDEVYYLRETITITEVLRSGRWIGNSGVGLHGFLFKLPVALIFFITGPSVMAATLFTFVLAMVSLFIFYRITGHYLQEEFYRWLVLILVAGNYIFIRSTVSYLREVPVLFSFCLLIYMIIKKKKWIVAGLVLLLVLDAKEHVFFQVLPGLGLWLIYYHFLSLRSLPLRTRLFRFIVAAIFLLAPSLIYIILMFQTSIIPLNMFLAYLLGLVSGSNSTPGLFDAMSAYGGTTQDELRNTVVFNFSFLINVLDRCHQSSLWRYFLKFNFPRQFSFLSIPKIIFIPVIWHGFVFVFKKEVSLERRERFLLLFLPLLTFLAAFYLRDSHGRYLFSIVPFMALFFVCFLRTLEEMKTKWILFAILVFFSITGLLFEITHLPAKLFINGFLLVFLAIIFVKSEKFVSLVKFRYIGAFCLCLAFFTGTAAVASNVLMEEGQIRQFWRFGYAGECGRIFRHLQSDRLVETNIADNFPIALFYSGQRIRNPEWYYTLKEWVPKKKMLRKYPTGKLRLIRGKDPKSKKVELSDLTGDILYLFKSTLQDHQYDVEYLIPQLLRSKQWCLTRQENLKNKILYVFERADEGGDRS